MGKFDWGALSENLQKDALNEGGKKNYEVDERFYKLARGDNDTGGALLRFLPDADGVPFIKMIQISANLGHEKRFISDWSPQSIGLPDPVNERFLVEWQAGNKEEAKRFGRKFRYIANVLVVKDPATPANEGKIFLLDMAKTTFDKVKNAADPTPDEVALGAEAKEVFNPLDGNNFLMKVKRGSNNFITYEDSKFDEKISGVYDTEAEYDKAIASEGHILGDFLKPEFFKSYAELEDSLAWYLNEKETAPKIVDAELEKAVEEVTKEVLPEVETVVEKPEVKKETAAKPVIDDDLDSLLDDLLD